MDKARESFELCGLLGVGGEGGEGKGYVGTSLLNYWEACHPPPLSPMPMMINRKG